MPVYPNRSHTIAERLIKLRDYLYANASPVHAVKTSDILTYLANEGHEVEIKTVYSDLKTLEAYFGLDLKYDGRQRGYLLLNPPFEPYELRLIVNSIQAAKFITQQEADKLTKKIMGLADKYTRPSLNRQTFIENRVRAINEDAMKGLDAIYEAIAQNRKISYKYFFYTGNSHKPKSYSPINGSKIHTASPYRVSWNGEDYTIIVTQIVDGVECKRILWLDHMEQIKILTDKREGEDLINKQPKFRRKRISQTKLKIYRGFVSFAIDKFGNNVIITPIDDEYCTVTVDERPTPELYIWTLKFHPHAEIISPEDAESRLRKYFLELSEGKEPYPPYR